MDKQRIYVQNTVAKRHQRHLSEIPVTIYFSHGLHEPPALNSIFFVSKRSRVFSTSLEVIIWSNFNLNTLNYFVYLRCAGRGSELSRVVNFIFCILGISCQVCSHWAERSTTVGRKDCLRFELKYHCAWKLFSRFCSCHFTVYDSWFFLFRHGTISCLVFSPVGKKRKKTSRLLLRLASPGESARSCQNPIITLSV
jgi:hypothetical protein